MGDPFTCEICGKSPPKGTGPIYRCNEKGVPGIWGCKAHREQLGWKPDPELDEIVNAISGENKSDG